MRSACGDRAAASRRTGGPFESGGVLWGNARSMARVKQAESLLLFVSSALKWKRCLPLRALRTITRLFAAPWRKLSTVKR